MASDERETFAPTTFRTRLVVGLYAVLGSTVAMALSVLGTNEWGEGTPCHVLWMVGLFLAVAGGGLLSVVGARVASR